MPTPRLDSRIVDNIIKDLTETNDSHQKIADRHGVGSGIISKIKIENSIIRPVVNRNSKAIKDIDPTDQRILDLEQQVIALRDEKSNLKKAYTASQRKNSLFLDLAEEIKDSVKPIDPLPPAPPIRYSGHKVKESLVLHLSDEHCCDVILPYQVGGLENYNFPVALRRAEILVDTIIKFVKHTLKMYEFDTLYILANGDHVSGEIHNATDHTEYRNVIRNCLATGQMQALMLRDLASHFNNVKIVYTSGNHGRRSIKKDYNSPRDNWDYLVAEIAAAYCRDLINTEFIIPDSFSINLDIEGHGFCVSHGDDIRSFNSIPWYGLERKTRRLAALNCAVDKRIDYYAFGHFHQPSTQSALNGETIINGCWTATSPYVYNSLASFTEPSQIIHGVHRGRGISWRLHIKLRTPDEANGPKRYSVILAK